MAYHRVATGTHEHRALLMAPAHYHDHLQLLLLQRGVNPAKGPAAPPRVPPVRVFDGRQEVQPTEAHIALCERFAAAALPRDMAKRTESTPAGIAWLFGED